MDEGQPAQGPHVVAIRKTAESYSSLQETLQTLNDEIIELHTHGFSSKFGHSFVRFIFVADYKFMLLCLGMKSANSRNACLYCEQSNVNYFNGGLRWREMLNPKKPGCKLKNLLPCFELKDTAIDTMHLFFRVTDKLFDFVAKELGETPSALHAFELALAEAGIRNRLRKNENGALEFSGLNSKDREKMLAMLCNAPLALPDERRARQLQALHKKFLSCYTLLKTSSDAEEIKETTFAFISLFGVLYQKITVTPYIHILAHHCHELVELHGCLGKFNQQSVEKANDTVKTSFYRNSNFIHGPLQVIQKANRILASKVSTSSSSSEAAPSGQ